MPQIPISFVVEGDTDDAVARRMAREVGAKVHEVFVRQGKPAVLRGLLGFNGSARSRPWFVLLDLDQDAQCAGEFIQANLPIPSEYMCLRLAIRSVESWLMADRGGFARFFRVRVADIPATPDMNPNPKLTLVNLARASTKAIVRGGMPPRPRGGRATGELYTSLLIEFAREHWDVAAARAHSPSLDSALTRLRELWTK